MDVENKIQKNPPILRSAVTFDIFLFAVKYTKLGNSNHWLNSTEFTKFQRLRDNCILLGIKCLARRFHFMGAQKHEVIILKRIRK